MSKIVYINKDYLRYMANAGFGGNRDEAFDWLAIKHAPKRVKYSESRKAK